MRNGNRTGIGIKGIAFSLTARGPAPVGERPGSIPGGRDGSRGRAMSLEVLQTIFESAPSTPITADELERARTWSQSCDDPEQLRQGFARLADELARRITKESLILKYFGEAEDDVRRLKGLVEKLTRHI